MTEMTPERLTEVLGVLATGTAETVTPEELSQLAERVSAAVRKGESCHCDRGYPGGCGCGNRMADILQYGY